MMNLIKKVVAELKDFSKLYVEIHSTYQMI